MYTWYYINIIFSLILFHTCPRCSSRHLLPAFPAFYYLLLQYYYPPGHFPYGLLSFLLHALRPLLSNVFICLRSWFGKFLVYYPSLLFSIGILPFFIVSTCPRCSSRHSIHPFIYLKPLRFKPQASSPLVLLQPSI